MPAAHSKAARNRAHADGDAPLVAEAFRRQLVRDLGAWFRAARRDLPWRRTRDAYAIWLSEVMLQQTRVTTVTEYYPRFLARYPSVAALAAASVDDVLSAWSGLGYYRRARALHQGAREVVARYGGSVPCSVSELRQIPGIGDYTAGAIASIAFGVRAPLVDGNVARVLARVFGVTADVRSPAGMRTMWRLAAELVPEEQPGAHNEALMELGATICLPREPRCDACPVRASCLAAASGRQGDLPVVAKKKAPKEVELAALVASRGERVLLGRRAGEGLFGGMWEPPMIELTKTSDAKTAMRLWLGDKAAKLVLAGHEKRVLTHRKFRIAVLTGTLRDAPRAPLGAYQSFAWLSQVELQDRGISTLARAVLSRAKGTEPG